MPELPQNAEQEIAELERVLTEKKAALEGQKVAGVIEEIPHPKEILREAIREKIAATPGSSTPQSDQPFPPPPPLPPPTVEPSSYLSEELRPKVQEFVNIAFEKSLTQAIQLAKATGNAALIDAFHDMIVDELFIHLVERGKLKSIG